MTSTTTIEGITAMTNETPALRVELRTPELDILLAKGGNATTAPLIAGYDFPPRDGAIIYGMHGVGPIMGPEDEPSLESFR